MKYIEYVNEIIRRESVARDYLVMFGQNVNAGSFIGGFTKGLSVTSKSKILNTPNSENTLVGFGFGVMLGGGSAIFFMKQLDFLFLGIDHLVNTYNMLRNTSKIPKGSFTIMPIVVDNGYQGPQSSSNNFGDFCSMARIPGFAITNQYDAEGIIAKHMVSSGFRILAISQRLSKEDLINTGDPFDKDAEMKWVQYSEGNDVTIVCFNFTFPYGWQLKLNMELSGMTSSLFNINYMTPIDWSPIIASVKKTKRIVILDDSKSENISAFSLLALVRKEVKLKKDIVVFRKIGEQWLNPISDDFDIDYQGIVENIKNNIVS